GYQHTEDHNATTAPTIVPTALERSGDFSQSVNAFGQRVTVLDPQSGQPFAGDQIPAGRLSPQAAALLRLYPLPNVDTPSGFNYQAPLLNATRQDSIQTRVT